jgi:transposase
MVWALSRVEGVPADHIVHFILDAVEQLPITDFRVNDRGSGSEQYPPRMMLALLIYCYATGRFGSRTIEAASYSDVAVRYNLKRLFVLKNLATAA